MRKRLINHVIVIIGIAVFALLAITCVSTPATIRDDYKIPDNKNWDEDIAEWTKYIRQNPRNAQAYNARGVAHYYKGNYSQAVANFEAALQLGDSNARDNLAKAQQAASKQNTSNPPLAQAAPSPAQIAPAPAESKEDDFQVEVTRDGKGVVILGYVGTATAVRIPAAIQGMPVREIGRRAFQGKSNITSVEIPEGVTTIQWGASGYNNVGAFVDCSALTSITLPKSLVSIGAYAFNACSSLKSITLPESLATIGDYTFLGCGITSITIPASVTSIGTGAFRGSGLTSITWPNGRAINSEMFRNCTNLQSVVIPEGITDIGSEAFGFCPALTSITLPSTIREIGSQAFYNCSSLTDIIIPDSVKRITFAPPPPFGNPVFSGCSKLSLATQAVLRRLGYTGSF